MPRDATGNYTLPAGNPVITHEPIESAWANSTMPDIAAALTDSLSRNGNGGMLVPFKFADGVAAGPGMSWVNEPTSGWYRAATNDFRYSVGAQDVLKITQAGISLLPGKTFSGDIAGLTSLETPLVKSPSGNLALLANGGVGLLQTNGPNNIFAWDSASFFAIAGDNTKDLGKAGTAFRSGYFATSVVTQLWDTGAQPSGQIKINGTPNITILSAQFAPTVDLGVNLGAAANRFATGYFGISVVTPNVSASGNVSTPILDLASQIRFSQADGSAARLLISDPSNPGNVALRYIPVGNTTLSLDVVLGNSSASEKLFQIQGNGGRTTFGTLADDGVSALQTTSFKASTSVLTPILDNPVGNISLRAAGNQVADVVASGNGGLSPHTDGVNQLGSAAARWGSGYFGFGGVTTPSVQGQPLANFVLNFATAGGCIGIGQVDGANRWRWDNVQFAPANDGTYNLGAAALRWGTGYFSLQLLLQGTAGGNSFIASSALNTGSHYMTYQVDSGGAPKTVLFGVDGPTARGFIGTLSNHPFDIRVNNLAVATFTASGLVGSLTPSFESAEIGCPAGSATTVAAHGLGRVPKSFGVYLRCKIAEEGWVVGDEIQLTHGVDTFANATSVGVVDASGIPLISRTTFAGLNATAANWRLIFRAW